MKRVARIVIGLAGIAIPVAHAEPALEFVRAVGDPAFKHAESLTHIEELPGDRLLASAEDGAARIWDLKTGEELQRFSHGDDDVWNAIPLQDGKHVATAGLKVRIWEIATGKMVLELEHESRAFRLAAIPGGNLLASGHDGSAIMVRDWKTGETVHQLKYPKDEVYTLIAPSEKRLITSGDNGVLQLWNLENGEKLVEIELEDDPRVTTLSLSPDRSCFAVNAAKKFLCFECDGLKKKWEVELDKSATISAWLPDGKHIATCSEDQVLKVEADKGKIAWKAKVPFDEHRAVAVSADGSCIYTGGDWMIYRFATGDGKPLFPEGERYLRGSLVDACFTDDADSAFTVGTNRYLHHFDLEEGEILDTKEFGVDIEALGITPARTHLLIAGKGGGLLYLDPESLKETHEVEIDAFSDLALATAGIFLTLDGRSARRWRMGKPLGSLGGDGSNFQAVAATLDGDLVAAITDEGGSAQLWDPETGALLRSISTDIDSPDDLYLFPDGNVVAVSEDEHLYAWFKPAINRIEGRDAEIVELLDLLASDAFWEREKAKRKLLSFGTGVVPVLEGLEVKDPEARGQVAQLLRVLRGKLAGAFDQMLVLDKDIRSFAIHPDGVHWVAVCGYGHTTQVVLGRCDRKAGKFEVLQTIDDPRAPQSAQFSLDGRSLITGNRTATLCLYRFKAGS